MSKSGDSSKGSRGPEGKGPFKYLNFEDNHVVWPGRAKALHAFIHQSYEGIQHKFRHAHSSNSEDALTWSCFDVLAHVPDNVRRRALTDIWELAFGSRDAPDGVLSGDIGMGKCYGEDESTEVDASIEGSGVLVFIEAKLYSPMSQANAAKGELYNQIERKLRVGLREALKEDKTFYFILLDLVPLEALRSMKAGASLEDAMDPRAVGFAAKWLTAYWFARYKYGSGGSSALLEKLISDAGFHGLVAGDVAKRMGWLTWADLISDIPQPRAVDARAGAW